MSLFDDIDVIGDNESVLSELEDEHRAPKARGRARELKENYDISHPDAPDSWFSPEFRLVELLRTIHVYIADSNQAESHVRRSIDYGGTEIVRDFRLPSKISPVPDFAKFLIDKFKDDKQKWSAAMALATDDPVGTDVSQLADEIKSLVNEASESVEALVTEPLALYLAPKDENGVGEIVVWIDRVKAEFRRFATPAEAADSEQLARFISNVVIHEVGHAIMHTRGTGFQRLQEYLMEEPLAEAIALSHGYDATECPAYSASVAHTHAPYRWGRCFEPGTLWKYVRAWVELKEFWQYNENADKLPWLADMIRCDAQGTKIGYFK